VRFDTKRKSGGKPPQIRPSPKQNRSESQFSCIFQEPMNRGKYAYMDSWVKHASGKSYCVSKITPVRSKNRRITVSVFLSTLQLTALVLKSFRLRLHCYTLECREATTGWRRDTGCLKLRVIFRKRATDYRALLRKMTYEDKASYDSTLLYTTKIRHPMTLHHPVLVAPWHTIGLFCNRAL